MCHAAGLLSFKATSPPSRQPYQQNPEPGTKCIGYLIKSQERSFLLFTLMDLPGSHIALIDSSGKFECRELDTGKDKALGSLCIGQGIFHKFLYPM